MTKKEERGVNCFRTGHDYIEEKHYFCAGIIIHFYTRYPMGGFFGTISTQRCITDLFYGTDYNSHLGTKRGGLATFSAEKGFYRSIHNLESQYFRTRFEAELQKFPGESGIGVISDTDPQPIVINSHLGKMAVVTVGKINNLDELTR